MLALISLITGLSTKVPLRPIQMTRSANIYYLSPNLSLSVNRMEMELSIILAMQLIIYQEWEQPIGCIKRCKINLCGWSVRLTLSGCANSCLGPSVRGHTVHRDPRGHMSLPSFILCSIRSLFFMDWISHRLHFFLSRCKITLATNVMPMPSVRGPHGRPHASTPSCKC